MLRHIRHDSIAIRLPNPDGTYTKLSNHIESTSGVVYLNLPNNRSGRVMNEKYPFFASSTNALVYFDQPEILGSAYDSTIVFIVVPIEIDDIDNDSTENLIFPGSIIAHFTFGACT